MADDQKIIPRRRRAVFSGVDLFVGSVDADAQVTGHVYVDTFVVLLYLLAEISRVAKPGGTLLVGFPCIRHAGTRLIISWAIKALQPSRLQAKLTEHHLEVARSAVFGMQPRSSRLLDWGMWYLSNGRERAMWWYNRAIMPIALWSQKELRLEPGFLEAQAVDEVLLVCKRQSL